MIPQRLISALKSGNIVLFLGAGANYNCTLSNGQRVPNGNQLTDLLSSRYNVKKTNSLAETAELVEAKHTRSELNRFLVELLSGAMPSAGFSLISSFKWSSIYTTNYDLLVEDAYSFKESVQTLKVYYTSSQRIDFGPNDVALYKLHGCISRADTVEGRLIITPDDYAEYRKHRSRLYYRLADHLSDKPFLYIGYGRQDSDFRSILADVHREMGGDLPEGYALFPGKTEEDDIVWNKKRITLIDMDVDLFFSNIRKEIPDHTYVDTPSFDFPIPKHYDNINPHLLNESLSYFSLPVSKYGTRLNAKAFFKGSEANWIDLHNKVEADRDIYDEIMGNLLEDALSIENQTTSYCLLAEAGAGKSTLLRRLAYDLCNDFQQIVFWYKGERRINFSAIESIFKFVNKRIFIFVDRGSKYLGNLESLRRECIAKKTPITIVIADRTNEWNLNSNYNFRYTKCWTISRLSDKEIEDIISKLEKFDCLGNLKHLSSEQRFSKFKDYSERQLLIALREATEGKDFDELVIDEYESITNATARKLYLYVCAMHVFGKGIRTSSLARSVGIKITDFYTYFKSLDGLIDYKDDVYMSRHSIISKILFFSSSEEERIIILEQLIDKLDLGYTSDYHVFKSLVNNADLIDSLGGIETRRRLFNALKNLKPSDPYIEQHEARMELRSVNEGGSLDRAEKLLKSALKRTDNATSIKHTVGLLYQEKSRQSTGLEKRTFLGKAIQEFIELIKREYTNEYAWTSLIESRINLGSMEEGSHDEYTRAEADYQKALECCGSSPFLFRAKGKLEAALGHGEEAREMFEKTISGVAPPANLYANYIKWALRHKNIPLSREVAEKAITLYKDNPEIVVLRMKSLVLGSDFSLSDVAMLFSHIQREVSGYYKMEAFFWYGVALWESAQYNDAITQFVVSKDIAYNLGRSDIKHIRYISGMNNGTQKEYSGSIVKNGSRSTSIICKPSGVNIFVNPNSVKDLAGSISMKIGFNRLGPVAIVDKNWVDVQYDNFV